MKTRQILLGALLAASLAPAIANEAEDAAQEARREVRVERVERAEHAAHAAQFRAHADAYAFATHGGHMVAGSLRMPREPVKNAPYSAEAVSERVQVLADGNQISKKHSTMSYRDSQGRTRQEIRKEDGAMRTILIQDGSTTLVLHPDTKSGTRVSPLIGERARAIAAEARERARVHVERIRKERKQAGEGGEEKVVRRFEHEGAGGVHAEEVRVRVMKQMEGKAEQLRRLAPAIARASADSKFARKATVKELGSRNFEGVKAEGKLSSYEIPAGEVGNARPIVVSDETWYSPELQVTVYSKHSDPRYGDRIYRLENIRRVEPPAELFTAPADFDIKDPAERLKRKMEEKAKKREEKNKDKQ
ncbi:MAG TPA: hypothetical protein VGE60_01190 [Telluria sp.]